MTAVGQVQSELTPIHFAGDPLWSYLYKFW